MIKGSIHKEDIAILNVYAKRNRATKYVSKTDGTEIRIDKFTIIVGIFNTPLSTMD